MWRRRRSVLEILLIHRPRYDDWSFPKGKVEKGEDFMDLRDPRDRRGNPGQCGVAAPGWRDSLPPRQRLA